MGALSALDWWESRAVPGTTCTTVLLLVAPGVVEWRWAPSPCASSNPGSVRSIASCQPAYGRLFGADCGGL